jgi:hypothetical protein
MYSAEILKELKKMPEFMRAQLYLLDSPGLTIRINPKEAPLLHDIQAVLRRLMAILEPVGAPAVSCEDCHTPYAEFPLDVTIPDGQWEKIMPGRRGGGILCANCIVRRASYLPGVVAVRAEIEIYTPPARDPYSYGMMTSDPTSGWGAYDPTSEVTSGGLWEPPPPKKLTPEEEQAEKDRQAFFTRFGFEPTIKSKKEKKR